MEEPFVLNVDIVMSTKKGLEIVHYNETNFIGRHRKYGCDSEFNNSGKVSLSLGFGRKWQIVGDKKGWYNNSLCIYFYGMPVVYIYYFLWYLYILYLIML